MTAVQEALRRWAKGLYSLEAGVELLMRPCGGRFSDLGHPWIQQGDDPGWRWIGVEQMNEDTNRPLSGGETSRVPCVQPHLLRGPPVDLSRNLGSLDRERT